MPVRALLVLVAWLLAGSTLIAQGDDYEREPIRYSATKAKDPIASLQAKLESGEIVFDASSGKAYLLDLLAHLGVPVESQVLVYSKTSFQNDWITPWRPRAIYFSEDYYIGWVQGGDIEIISVDPDLGPVFYRMIVPKTGTRRSVEIVRSRDCLSCHGGSRTNNAPGMLVRSVRTDAGGSPLLGAGTFQTDHSSPIAERWGGWYVTGEIAGARHMGNLIFQKTGSGGAEVSKDLGRALKDLSSVINTKPYPTPRSDVVALMVLEHQITVHNAMAQAHATTRRIIHSNQSLAKHWGDSTGKLTPATAGILERQADRVLEAMLFCDERRLENWGVEGAREFQDAFLKNARRNSENRSLKDFWLVSRLFKYRLSYMIYSRAFDHLPDELKSRVYQKLWAVLHGKGDPKRFGHLPQRERERILAILLETKSGLPDYWKRENE